MPMLLLVFLVHLTKKSGLAQGQTLDSRELTPSSFDNINSCRTLFNIVWGCLSTIFVCTWVAVHQNISRSDRRWLSIPAGKLNWVALMIIAPELVVSLAATQFVDARDISKKFRISKTHALFFCMSGFVSQDETPIPKIEQLPEYIPAIEDPEEADIMDKGKGDALSKVTLAWNNRIYEETNCWLILDREALLTGSPNLMINLDSRASQTVTEAA
ncbi:hypothetical protein FB451DRAFT_1162848 [Mycena latifolia]|nr:hypothetical protein FB451DRAFT_1162848 [Mycena latifolia]